MWLGPLSSGLNPFSRPAGVSWTPMDRALAQWSSLWIERFVSAAWVSQRQISTDRGSKYPAWSCQHSYGKWPFFMGKSTISMVIFNSYVKLPEGIAIEHGPVEIVDDYPAIKWWFPSSLWDSLPEGTKILWLVVWNMNFIFQNIWENPSHWQTHIFQDG